MDRQQRDYARGAILVGLLGIAAGALLCWARLSFGIRNFEGCALIVAVGLFAVAGGSAYLLRSRLKQAEDLEDRWRL